jgi:hypothetical protein
MYISNIEVYQIVANVRVYEPLRCQSALLSSYHEVTKSADPRKLATSNLSAVVQP